MLLFMIFGIAVLSVFFPIFAEAYGDNTDGWFKTYVIVWLSTAGLMALTTSLWGIPEKKSKADRMVLAYDNYIEFEGWFCKEVVSHRYIEYDFVEDNIFNVRIFVKQELMKYSILLVTNVGELTEEILDLLSGQFNRFLEIHYPENRFSTVVCFTPVICVKRLTPAFTNYVNTYITQGYQAITVPIGISFGGRTVYIAKNTTGLGKAVYKKARKDFMKIMGDKIKPLKFI